MRIEQTVEVDAPLDRVWALVNDVPRVAPCMLGATFTKVVDERTYEGTVRVKLGLINLFYKGTVVLDLHLTGRVASFGRGAVQDVSARLFGEFAQCLR